MSAHVLLNLLNELGKTIDARLSLSFKRYKIAVLKVFQYAEVFIGTDRNASSRSFSNS